MSANPSFTPLTSAVSAVRLSPVTPRQAAFGTLCGALIAAVTPLLARLIAACGHQIPEADMVTDYLRGVLWAIALGLSIFLWPVSPRSKRCLLWGWFAKGVTTLVVMLLYENNYGLDSYGYFGESRNGEFQFSALNFKHGTENVKMLVRLHRQYLPDSYHALKVSFAMLGLVGIFLFYRSAALFLRREEERVFYLLALFPGILFWSSTLGKDPLVFFGIALYSYGVVSWHRLKSLRSLLFIAAGVLVAVFIRPWLGLIMLLPVGLVFVFGIRSWPRRMLFIAFIALAVAINANVFMERFKIGAFEDILEVSNKTTAGFQRTAGGSTQQLDADLSSVGGLVSFLPVGAFTALFRPFPGEVMNPFGMLAGVENALLLYLLLRAVLRTRLAELKEPLVLWAILFVVIWAMVNGIVSSANFGVAVRYKLQVLPVLLGVLLYLSRDRNISKAMPTLRFTWRGSVGLAPEGAATKGDKPCAE